MSLRNLIVAGEWRGNHVRFRNDQIIVSVLESVPARQIKDTLDTAIAVVRGATLHPPRRGRRWAIVGLPQGTDIVQAATLIALQPGIKYAEPDFVLYAHALPNDTEYAAGHQGWIPRIKLEDAWTITQGDAGVLLAVLDSGIEVDGTSFGHEDLTDPGFPDLADLGGRYIVRHHNAAGIAVHHDYIDDDETPEDLHGHGTWVTGILAAMSNDGKGVAGVNWVSKVYVARVLDAGKVLPTPVSTVSIVWTAMEDLVDYATVHKYERVVVNMSFGSKDPSSVQPDMKAAVELLIESLRDMCVNAASFPLPDGATGRCVIFCAAEFYGSAPHAYASYPARFAAEADFPHVISVGSTDAADAVALPASASTEPANEREVTILAPGNASPCTTLLGSTYGVPYQQGASLASPMVAGAVSLMWSTNPTLTPAEIKECLWNTGRSITRGEREYRRLDAGNAVRSAKRTISLDTPVLSFADVPAGSSDARTVEMSITACASLTFRVQSTAMDAAFAIDPESMAFDPLTSAGVATGIQVTYTAGTAGSAASGSFVIECEQSLETWTVELTANTAAAPAAAVVLVADKSGSMGAMSGIGTKTRMDVLHDALATTVEVLRTGDACAVVSFDTNATTVQAPVDITNDDPVDPERDPLYTAVNGLSGGGATSIGDGVRLASTLVPADGARGPALLVVTDGHENTAEFIADVMDEIDVPVYAIGMGTAAVIRPESLESLANATGGYLLLTDTLDEENRDRVAKYCLQMLVEASGSDLIVDPSGWVRPGQEIDIPFWISGEDRSCDVIVLMPSKGAVDVELVSPGGRRIDKTSRLPGVAFRSGRHTSLYRLDTAEGGGGKGAVGRWKARLSISEASAKSHAKRLKGRQRVRFDAHGAPYCLLVSCRSGVRMSARAYAASHEPGSRVLLRTVITERSQPLHSPAAVTARISFPDGTQSPCTLRRAAPGVNEYELTARMPGVYTCRVRATGLTVRGERYQREQTITAHIWNGPRGTASVAPRGPSRPR